jgi:Holliday junction resolvasome RuvABC endonuclease subunit
LAAGVIVTKPQTKQAKRHQTASEANLTSGLAIFHGITEVIRCWEPVVAAQEGAGGSKSVSGAQSLARSQQACGDAVYRHLGGMPIMPTVQAVKKRATGNMGASKAEIEAAMRARWASSDFDEILTTPPPYAERGQGLPAPGLWENAFDAAAVAHCVWDDPAVALARQMAA